MAQTQVKDAYSIAVIGGDGIGPEVVAEGLKVLDAVTGDTGAKLPDSVLDELRGHDAILLGAIGDPSVPSGVLERGVLLPLRFALDHYVNLRPATLFPGVSSPLGVARVVRDAFARAQARPLRHLTLVHKHNVLTYAGHLWRRTVEEVGAEFP